MKVVVQRSLKSNVSVDNKIVGSIAKGLVLLIGFTESDNEIIIDKIVKKILNLRIFDDNNGIMNKSIKDINGSILSISQFTLYGDISHGNRPSYMKALKADEAIILYDLFNKKLSEFIHVETGIFGSNMKVSITNDGPVTIIIESEEL